jgi:phage terminase large subunit-like protein
MNSQLANSPHFQKMTDEQALELLFDWDIWSRPKQREPQGDWRVWLILAGRGFGKTRTGAEYIRKQVEKNICGRIALVGRTAADVRDVMVEGESGILAASHPNRRPKYEPSKRRLTWPNGAIATTYSADEPDTLRGPQHDGFWADEPAAWKYDDTWDQLMFGLRLGKNPRGVATTTPRPTKLIKSLVASPTTYVTRGNTYENRAHLAPAFLEQIIRKYEGTRLGRQELNAEILEDTEGALWQRDSMLEAYRVTKHPPLIRIGVAVDPSVTSGEGSAETGIIAGGIAENGHAYILDDCSVLASPREWAASAIVAYHKNFADFIVGETNQGGDMVETIIRGIDTNVAFRGVRATRGKYTRAEPVAALYERGLVHHVGAFPELEDQLCSWTQGEKSPDRLDALVWLLTALMLNAGVPLAGDEPEEQPAEQPTLTQIMASDPFSWATSHGMWEDN